MSSQFSASSPLHLKLMAALRENSTNAVLFHASMAEKYGLNATDHKCLDFIIRNGPVTAGQIMTYTGLTSGAVTGIINRLEKKGFVRRGKDPGDHRKVIVEKIPQSLEPIDLLFQAIHRDTLQLLNRYSEAELTVILDFVTRCNTMTQSHMSMQL